MADIRIAERQNIMTKFNSLVTISANILEAQKLADTFNSKIETTKSKLDGQKDNQEKHFIDRTIWAVIGTYTDKGQNEVFWNDFSDKTSEGTRKVTSAFKNRFVKANPDCSCTVTSPESLAGTYKLMVETFKNLDLDTMKAIKEYNKPEYVLSDIAVNLANDIVKKSVSVDGFLSVDQEEKFLEDVLKMFEKHEKKNK